jgi:hypothetical protein
MKFLEIRKDKFGFSTRFVEKTDIITLHKFSNDITSWLSGPLPGSRYVIAKPDCKYAYFRVDKMEKDEINRLGKEL